VAEQNDFEFLTCDLNSANHAEQFYELLAEYMKDKMGGEVIPPFNHKEEVLKNFPKDYSSMILFVKKGNLFIGMAVCFINFSTFKAKPYINVHDLIIRTGYRGKGYGKALLQKVIDIAAERNFCKVTLEVREDNLNAQALYKQLGFKDTNPVMWFWTRSIL
jgi:ribosomal protein S18 acetylase RimI-like enzyme